MANRRILIVCYVALILFLAHTCASVYGSETLPLGVERIRTYCVWDQNMDMTVDPGANAGNNIVIGVIDTGIDYYLDDYLNKVYHPDLSNNVAGGRGFQYYQGQVYQNPVDWEDPWGHGTHVSGTIAAVDNTIGVIGTAPKARIFALKYWVGNHLEIVEAINWAVDNGIHIISMSFCSYNDYADVRQACDNAYSEGTLLLASVDNLGLHQIPYPAKYDSVIAVGAVDENLNRPSWSNYGPELEFVAPGVNINSTWINESYKVDEGTSFAVPHVTGVAAMIWNSKIDPNYDEDQDGEWDNTEVRAKMQSIALDLGSPGWMKNTILA